jgi:hypothetical protein
MKILNLGNLNLIPGIVYQEPTLCLLVSHKTFDSMHSYRGYQIGHTSRELNNCERCDK